MSNDDFLFWNAAELVAAFTAKTLSPVDVVTASLAHAETVQARCNPITEFFSESALIDAGVGVPSRQVETRLIMLCCNMCGATNVEYISSRSFAFRFIND